MRQIADKTLLVGLGSTVFREAKYTSHEVIIDDAQIAWFERTLEEHPSADGWKIFVFTHAPPIGSGLRVLQHNHVVNGCCWLNHSGGATTRKFIELVRKHRCVKAWFSGHFHLGQDYEDSITFPTIDPSEGPYLATERKSRSSVLALPSFCGDGVAAAPRLRRGYPVETGSRRRRGCDVDIPRRRIAAAPRLRRGSSVDTRHLARRSRLHSVEGTTSAC